LRSSLTLDHKNLRKDSLTYHCVFIMRCSVTSDRVMPTGIFLFLFQRQYIVTEDRSKGKLHWQWNRSRVNKMCLYYGVLEQPGILTFKGEKVNKLKKHLAYLCFSKWLMLMSLNEESLKRLDSFWNRSDHNYSSADYSCYNFIPTKAF
jgi:hypothetical protein